MSEWIWLLAAVLAGGILYLIPRRIVGLHQKGQLSARRFALTLSIGWSLAIIVFYYVGLIGVILERRDPLLAALGLLIAALNLMLGYPVARLLYRYVMIPLLDRNDGR
ncbi:MAG: hypothetical protein BMS9Abin28_2371 [Anaerolineae bacterium]|nr:MAG: hypothetical protein BMS9Abin28_2371 [Anaerolineae bacterium]